MSRRSFIFSIISLDFSKAFDSIRHSALAAMPANADIPDFIYTIGLWSFLRIAAIQPGSQTSGQAYITAIIVQGSGIGPTACDISTSDLHQGNY